MSAPLTFKTKAECAYGSSCPAWILALADACDAAGFVKPVASRIGYSHSAVSAVINRSYTGKTERIQEAVQSCLMSGKVICPVLGEIPSERCHNIQGRKKLRATDPSAVQLWRACHGACPNKRKSS